MYNVALWLHKNIYLYGIHTTFIFQHFNNLSLFMKKGVHAKTKTKYIHNNMYNSNMNLSTLHVQYSSRMCERSSVARWQNMFNFFIQM